MKTHDLARSLNYMARVLRAGPNIELDELSNFGTYLQQSQAKPTKKSAEVAEKGAALALLSQLAQTKKPELIGLIRQLDIDVEVKPTDSVRDLLGRTLNYIAEHPDVGQRLTATGQRTSADVSPRLMKALQILLGQQ